MYQIIMFDGANLDAKICEEDAISFIVKFQLQSAFVKNSSETNFQFKDEHKGIQLSVRYRDGSYVIYVGGSLHKFHKATNTNDFPFSEVEIAKENLKEMLCIKGSTITIDKNLNPYFQKIVSIDLRFKSLEVGVNVEVPFPDVFKTLRENLVQHKGVRYRLDKNVFRFEHENYQIKLYEKGVGLLRYEIKFLSKELVRYKIKSLDDLNMTKALPMAERLKKELSEIVFKSKINIHTGENLTPKEHLDILKFTNQWHNEDYSNDRKKADKKKKALLSQQQSRRKKRLKSVLSQKGDGIGLLLSELIGSKIDSYFFNSI